MGDNDISTVRDHPNEYPFWLTRPCPPWCIGEHYDWQSDEERRHSVEIATVQFQLHPGMGRLHEPQVVHVSIDQGYRDAEPHIESYFLIEGDSLIKLTLDEAAEIASALMRAVDTARKVGRS